MSINRDNQLNDTNCLGAATPRIDAHAKVTGRARYAADHPLPNRLFAGILRCPHAHARVAKLDTSAAEAIPGVRAVLSSRNTDGHSWYEEESPTFSEVCRFAGEEVAAVAADTRECLAEALSAIVVEYEIKPFVTHAEAAKASDAPLVHEQHTNNLVSEPDCYLRGDVEAAFAAADVIVEREFSTACAVHNALEPHGCTAQWHDGRLMLWSSTQGIFSVRQGIAEKLGLEENQVDVHCDFMGGGFGAKQVDWKPTLIAALLARSADRPVELLLDRRGENLAAGNRQASTQRVRLGASSDGKLCAIEVTVDCAVGAYTVGGESSPIDAIYQLLYRCDNVRTTQHNYYSNTGPAVAFRGPGFAEGAAALEQAIDELARRLDMNPYQFRRANIAREDQLAGQPYSSPDALSSCLDAIEEAETGSSDSGESRPERRRGSGVAACVWMAGKANPPAKVRLRLYRHGILEVFCGTQDIGTGTRTVLAQIAADALDFPLERIRCDIGSTNSEFVAPTSSGSCTTPTLAPAVYAASKSLRDKLGVPVTTAAARQLEGAYVEAVGECPNDSGEVSIKTFGAQRAEVEVNMRTGEITVLRLDVATDCGRVVNPLLAKGQVMGGAIQGLGYALTEERLIDEALGVVVNANLEDYEVPTAADVPLIDHLGVDMADQHTPAPHVKGLGEPPLIPAAPAIANAVYDATGLRLSELPITRARLLTLLDYAEDLA